MCSQGRHGTPWRRPFPRRLQALGRQRPGREVAVDELQHPSVRDPLLNHAPQLVVVAPVEALLYVQVYHPAIALPQLLLGLRHRLMRRAPRTAPLAARRKGRVPFRLQPLPQRVRDEPVQHGGHPELTYPAPWLRDLAPFHRLRLVRPGHQRFPDLWPLLPHVPRSLFDGHPIHPWAAALPLHPGQCREEMPPLHDPFHQAHLPNRSVPSRCSNRGFTPPLRDGQLELLCRCVASVQPPLNPPADRLGLRPIYGVPSMPSADFCMAVRGDLSPLSPCRGFRMRCVFSVAAWFPGGATLFHPYLRPGRHADLPGEDTELSMRRRRMYQAHPTAPG